MRSERMAAEAFLDAQRSEQTTDLSAELLAHWHRGQIEASLRWLDRCASEISRVMAVATADDDCCNEGK